MKRKPQIIKTKQTQKTLSKKLGVSQPTISNWLNLSAKPTGLARTALQNHYPKLLKRIDKEWNSQ